MAKKDPVENKLFWAARQRVDLSRQQLADAANQQPIIGKCEHVPLNENYIGRIEQGRVGGGMCHERLTALCVTLEVDDPADIGLIAERRHPTRTAPTRPRQASHTLTAAHNGGTLRAPGGLSLAIEDAGDAVGSYDVVEINRQPLLE